ncbi:MAG: hypothetical protein N2C12_03220 [Planctomycetales bacterium]
MKTFDTFQFNACPNTPAPLHRTEMEIIEYCNSQYRSYYEHAAKSVFEFARSKGLTTVVELGAGSAPITRAMLRDSRSEGMKFIVSDLIPDTSGFGKLEEQYPEQVTAIYESVDFTQPRDWGDNALLVLSAAFHHISHKDRAKVFETMSESACGMLIFGTVRRTWWCLFSAMLAIVPSLMLPIGYMKRPGRLRRLLWCWLIPLAPFMMIWDGVGGCLRHWTRTEWEQAHQSVNISRSLTVCETSNLQVVSC